MMPVTAFAERKNAFAAARSRVSLNITSTKLADVPLLGPVTDRFTIQPGEIEFITVGSIEVITHPSAGEDDTEPTTAPARQPGKLVEPLTDRDMSLPAASRWASA